MKKFLAVSLPVFFLLVLTILFIHSVTGSYFVTNDHYFHFYRSQGDCFTEHYSDECLSYPPLLAWLTFSSESEFGFILFVLALVVFFIPLVIYRKTESLWSLAIYFSSFFLFNVLYAGIYAQALLAFLFVLILSTKKPGSLDIVWLLFGLLAHSHFLYVLIPAVIYKVVRDIEFDSSFNPGYVFLANSSLDFSTLFKFFAFPLWFYFFKLDLSTRLLVLYFLFASFIDYRAGLFIPLIFSFELPKIFRVKPLGVKILLLALMGLFFVFLYLLVFFYVDGVFWLNQKV